ncbi:uncharacterized protein ATNIH1004_008746 [Aspergillus tanneri]|uniref:Alpha/beta hydrolase fold-3 domain-containing protein n=1 Tax=Aspergillus tanneri TaxID=1220188 RepID=A0A5M9MBZ3_9EURO|nr:uncharacterized protein ATNIH1004_008746 [Aspergillus tanneri]KAA8644542.1 hypothetical protein ATNIH1004_008746 [Aspergillus tanneri]
MARTKYRLAPQFPFPCALQDSLAAYLFLLDQFMPNEILFAGDSAGGGMVVSMLVTIRDQGLPLPAGAILISPWVDLTHSFPSIMKDNPGDFLPPYGFRHKPSAAWPPPSADEVLALQQERSKKHGSAIDAPESIPATESRVDEAASKRYSVSDSHSSLADASNARKSNPTDGGPYSIKVPVDGQIVEVKDQVQMYTTNPLISHPLVSPVLQPSLGGLPPLQILTGGGEKLRDEQIYLAHKAANPTDYPPGDVSLDENDPNREILHKYAGTYVQLQVWDDLCHTVPALSFTRPAKYMYRSIAQFGAWALACAQETEIEILDDNTVSPISSSDSDTPSAPANATPEKSNTKPAISSVGMAGDPLPAFKNRMVRQRVDKRGRIYPLDPVCFEPVLQLPPSYVGSINPSLLKKWLAAKDEWDVKFAKEKLHMQQKRKKELAYGLKYFKNETPPPCSLAARKEVSGVLPSWNARKSYPMTLWSHWASKHDKKAIVRERQREKEVRRSSVGAGQAGASIKQPASHGDVNPLIVQSPGQGQASSLNPRPAADIMNADTYNADKSTPDTTSTGVSPTQQQPPERTLSPLVVLPPYESKPRTEETASTQTLFHAPGIIAPTSDPSNMRHKHCGSSHTGSATARSRFTSDIADDTSTLGDRSVAVTTTGVDAASTRAVRHATGVVSAVTDPDSRPRSVEAPSASRDSGDLASSSSLGARSQPVSGDGASSRPGMSDQDAVHTADE